MIVQDITWEDVPEEVQAILDPILFDWIPLVPPWVYDFRIMFDA